MRLPYDSKCYDLAASDGVLQDDLTELLTILGLPTHARPQSPHEVFQEALIVLRERMNALAAAEQALAHEIRMKCEAIADLQEQLEE